MLWCCVTILLLVVVVVVVVVEVEWLIFLIEQLLFEELTLSEIFNFRW